jgi:hypothetical protein
MFVEPLLVRLRRRERQDVERDLRQLIEPAATELRADAGPQFTRRQRHPIEELI